MYTTPPGNIIRKHGLSVHVYADQLYISFHQHQKIQQCLVARHISRISKARMSSNLLKLNDDKTELIIINTHNNTSQNQYIAINVGDTLITPSGEPPRNLGVLIDSTCSLDYHVSKICKSTMRTMPSGCCPCAAYSTILHQS